ncbi:MAG: stage IV sporulation protein A [Ruminococcaceae bacterium]|nr:stage IV sporulation protein A [Oscillospiraceae bacterium]
MAERSGIYQDIATRTGGDIYIGVVGPVRTGKSTFIKKFMEKVVLPNMEDGAEKSRATDEMPQSGSGKNVMTTEPKFVPEKGVRIVMEGDLGFQVKLIDCVGFPIPGAAGLEEDGKSRMVNTPWSQEPLSFEEAASLGTQKVIREHSTVGVVVSTDGSIGEIPREAYLKAEEDIIEEMKKTGKPFIILLNSTHPDSEETAALASHLAEKHKVTVLPVNCYLLEEEDILRIISKIVLEFPIRRFSLLLPPWVCELEEGNALMEEILTAWESVAEGAVKTGEILSCIREFSKAEHFESVEITTSDLGTGSIFLQTKIKNQTFYQLLSKESGLPVSCEEELLTQFCLLAKLKEKYSKIAKAMDEVNESGYGIVTPDIEDLTLEEPEIVKHPGGYGVKLKASAPSIHLIRANIEAEVSPIVGSERQSEDIVKFLLKEFEEDPTTIWQSNMFGKSLYELVNEGLNTKLNQMPADAREKLAETLQKIINEGSNGLICIIL